MKAVVVNPESTDSAIEEKVLRPLETGGSTCRNLNTVVFATLTSIVAHGVLWSSTRTCFRT